MGRKNKVLSVRVEEVDVPSKGSNTVPNPRRFEYLVAGLKHATTRTDL